MQIEKNRKISKVKFQNEVTIVEINHFEGEIKYRTTIETEEQRHPDFTKAGKDMIALYEKLLNFKKDYLKDAEFRTASISFKPNQGFGLIVTMVAPVEGMASPLILNTPFLNQALENDQSLQKMPYELEQAFDQFYKHAEFFVDGERAQVSLALEPEKVTKISKKAG